MVNLIISGPYGRMGQALCRLAEQDEAIHLLGGLVADAEKPPTISSVTFGRTASQVKELLPGPTSSEGGSRCILVDFTQPAATLQRLTEAADLAVGMVIGTTGFSPDQEEEIHAFAQRIPVLLSANMSLGINLITGIVENLAGQLKDYDIEILEMHHRLKKDAPSGTALTLARAAAAGRSANLDDVATHGRSGMVGERNSAEIGIHAVRGGDVVGDHTVMFAGQGERIEIVHKATSRDTFAAGALAAAKFLATQPPGVYTMADVLGISSLKN